jgi:hypothetical protein
LDAHAKSKVPRLVFQMSFKVRRNSACGSSSGLCRAGGQSTSCPKEPTLGKAPGVTSRTAWRRQSLGVRWFYHRLQPAGLCHACDPGSTAPRRQGGSRASERQSGSRDFRTPGRKQSFRTPGRKQRLPHSRAEAETPALQGGSRDSRTPRRKQSFRTPKLYRRFLGA